MLPFIVGLIAVGWIVVFILTEPYKWRYVFRSLCNIGFIQLVFLVDLFPPYYVTLDTHPWLVTAVITSAVSYNACDCVNMILTKYPQTGIFLFHHIMVILGALLPIVSNRYWEAYVYGGEIEWTSIAYNIEAMYELGYIGQHWSSQHKKDAFTAYVLFYSIVRIIALGMMYELYFNERVFAPWWANAIYLIMTTGILLFSFVSVLDMLGISLKSHLLSQKNQDSKHSKHSKLAQVVVHRRLHKLA